MSGNRERIVDQKHGPGVEGFLEKIAVEQGDASQPDENRPTAARPKAVSVSGLARTRLRTALTGRILFSEPFAISSLVSTKYTMTDEDERELQTELARLQQEHRDLDAAIDALHQSPAPDLLRLQRLKKRKLQLRDRIAFIEDQITPDIIA